LGLAERRGFDEPVTRLFQVQKFEDRLAIHIGWCIESCNIQDRRGQVDVKNNLWDSAKRQTVTAQTHSQQRWHFRTSFPQLRLTGLQLFSPSHLVS
jgi:hypothetical protein